MKKLPFWFVGLSLFVLGLSAISWMPATLNGAAEADTSLQDSSAAAKSKSAAALFDEYVNTVYSVAGLEKSSLNLEVFRKAVIGYYNFKNSELLSRSLITIVDFNKPSREKRLWIIDLENKKLLFNTLVAHGQGSGDDMANNFSNITNSHQSSLGFYITDQTYSGKHGLSLKLNGMDEGFNTNAKDRAIVVHGADYVSESFIARHGRLGRSFGCPALPVELTASIINTIKGKTCLFINGNSNIYKSAFLDQQAVLNKFSPESTPLQASL